MQQTVLVFFLINKNNHSESHDKIMSIKMSNKSQTGGQ